MAETTDPWCSFPGCWEKPFTGGLCQYHAEQGSATPLVAIVVLLAAASFVARPLAVVLVLAAIAVAFARVVALAHDVDEPATRAEMFRSMDRRVER